MSSEAQDREHVSERDEPEGLDWAESLSANQRKQNYLELVFWQVEGHGMSEVHSYGHGSILNGAGLDRQRKDMGVWNRPLEILMARLVGFLTHCVLVCLFSSPEFDSVL